MSQFTVSVPCDPYLLQWTRHDNASTGTVRFRKGTPEAIFLEKFIAKPPFGWHPSPPSPGDLTIEIPDYRYKSPESYHYLSPRAAEALLKLLRRRFDLDLWTDLEKLSSYYSRKDLLIAAWMESHGIEDTERNTLAVTKRLQRLTDRIRTRERRRSTRSPQ